MMLKKLNNQELIKFFEDLKHTIDLRPIDEDMFIAQKWGVCDIIDNKPTIEWLEHAIPMGEYAQHS